MPDQYPTARLVQSGAAEISKVLKIGSELTEAFVSYKSATKAFSDAAWKFNHTGLKLDEMVKRVADGGRVPQGLLPWKWKNDVALKKLQLERANLTKERFSSAKYVVGALRYLLKNAVKPSGLVDDELYRDLDLGLETVEVLAKLGELWARARIGSVGAKTELSAFGGYVSGAGSSPLIVVTLASQSYDLGFLAGKKVWANVLRYGVSPDAAKDWDAMARQFEKDGGYLTVFAGILSSADVGALDTMAYGLQRWADFSFAGYMSDVKARSAAEADRILSTLDD